MYGEIHGLMAYHLVFVQAAVRLASSPVDCRERTAALRGTHSSTQTGEGVGRRFSRRCEQRVTTTPFGECMQAADSTRSPHLEVGSHASPPATPRLKGKP